MKIFDRPNLPQRQPREGSPTNWISFAGTALITLGGCAQDAPPASPMDMTAPHLLENARTFNAGLASAIVVDGDVNVYVNAVGARIYDAARTRNGSHAIAKPVHVDLLTNDVPLAFTFGGDHIYFSTGALRLCASEEDLAAALAHVYAHLLDRHQEVHDQVNTTDLLIVADVLARWPSSDREEQMADQDGFLLFARGGWDPAKYANAWSRLGGLEGPPRTAAILSFIGKSPSLIDEWRKPPVADRFTFHNIATAAVAIPDRSDAMTKLLMKCVKSCVGNDNIIARTAAIESLESQMKRATGDGPVIGPGPSHVW